MQFIHAEESSAQPTDSSTKPLIEAPPEKGPEDGSPRTRGAQAPNTSKSSDGGAGGGPRRGGYCCSSDGGPSNPEGDSKVLIIDAEGGSSANPPATAPPPEQGPEGDLDRSRPAKACDGDGLAKQPSPSVSDASGTRKGGCCSSGGASDESKVQLIHAEGSSAPSKEVPERGPEANVDARPAKDAQNGSSSMLKRPQALNGDDLAKQRTPSPSSGGGGGGAGGRKASSSTETTKASSPVNRPGAAAGKGRGLFSGGVGTPKAETGGPPKTFAGHKEAAGVGFSVFDTQNSMSSMLSMSAYDTLEEAYQEMTKEERKETRTLVKDFVKGMVKGRDLEVITGSGEVRTCFCSIGRKLDKLKVSVGHKDRDKRVREIPLGSVTEVVAGSPEGAAGHDEHLACMLSLATSETITFRLPDTDSRDQLVTCLSLFSNQARQKEGR